MIRARFEPDIEACVKALRLVHETDAYPSRWPDDPAAWLSPARTIGAWIAVSRGTIVGHIAIGDVDRDADPHLIPEALAAGRHVCEIMRLFVVPSARRIGTGSSLIDAALGFARAARLHPVLEVSDDRAAAIDLYERSGWHRSATYPATWRRPTGERPLLHRYER
ncbi:MAG TPA: GNAT family N-acetyltransferase [Candidatus Elarobacter sp.]